MNEYIRKLQQWRDKYERILDARPRVQSLDNLSHYLIEFQYTKFDEVEVPGQYTEASFAMYRGACVMLTRLVGQGQQQQLCPDTAVWTEVRELSVARLLLAAFDNQGT